MSCQNTQSTRSTHVIQLLDYSTYKSNLKKRVIRKLIQVNTKTQCSSVVVEVIGFNSCNQAKPPVSVKNKSRIKQLKRKKHFLQ